MNAQWLKRLPLIVICIAVGSIIATPIILSSLKPRPNATKNTCKETDVEYNDYAISQDISLDYQPLSAVIDNRTNTVIVGGTSTVLDIFSLTDENQFIPPINTSFNFHSLALNEKVGLLAGGTSNGVTVVWQKDNDSEVGWVQNATILPGKLGAQVSSVAISDDGSLVSASSEDALFVWHKNRDNNEWTLERQQFGAHSSTDILGVVFDYEGKLLSIGNDSRIKVWEPVGDSDPLHIYVAQDNVESIALHTKTIFSGLKDGVIEVWDVTAQQNSDLASPKSFNLHSGAVKSLAISIEENILVSGSNDQEIKVWGLCNQSELQTLTDHKDRVNSVDISATGSTIVSTGIDKRLIIRSR